MTEHSTAHLGAPIQLGQVAQPKSRVATATIDMGPLELATYRRMWRRSTALHLSACEPTVAEGRRRLLTTGRT